jgi:HEAT repeat protein
MNDDDVFDERRSLWLRRALWAGVAVASIAGVFVYRGRQPRPSKGPGELLRVMHNPSATSVDRHLAAVALGKSDGFAAAQVAPALIDDLAHGDGEVRFLAAVALTRLGAKAQAAKAALIQATADPERRVRQQAAQALAQNTSDADVVAALAAAAQDADFDVSGAALVALRFQHAAGAAALVTLLADREANVRRRAAIELGRLPAHAETTGGPLHQALAHDGDFRVRAEALAALHNLSLLRVEELIAAYHDRDLRRTAFAVFSTDADAVPELRRLLTSEDEDLAQRATSALGHIGPAAHEAVDDLLAHLDVESEDEVFGARLALRSIGLEAKHKPPDLWDRVAESKNDVKSLVLRDDTRFYGNSINPIRHLPRASHTGDRDMRHVAGLVSLRYLNLSFTDVGDAGLAHLASLANLEWLDLSHTRVTSSGLVHLVGLTNLRELRLDECRVTDEGLAHLKNLGRLERLWLTDTDITDAGLAHLAGLHELKSLMLGKTNLTDAGMPHLAGLRRLKTLYLYQTQVTDAGLAQLSKLDQLGELGFGQGQFTTEAISQFRGLTELRLHGPNIGDAELAPLSRLTHLKTLALTGTSVTDAGLKHLAGLLELAKLQLDSTATSDAGLMHLKPLIHLQTLSLTKTRVTEEGIEQLKRALPDVSVSSDFGSDSDSYQAIGLRPAG